MHSLCTNISFNFIIISPIPIPTHDEMSVGSVEKCTKHLQVITITFPCKQPIMKHDMDKFNLTQFECRIRNLINLKVNRNLNRISCFCHSKYHKSIMPPLKCDFFQDVYFFLWSSVFSIHLLPADI